MPLLSDPNEEVRIEALCTLSDAGELRPQHLAQAPIWNTIPLNCFAWNENYSF